MKQTAQTLAGPPADRRAVGAGPLTEGNIPHAILRIALPTWGAFVTHDLMVIVGAALVLLGVPLAYALARTWGDVSPTQYHPAACQDREGFRRY